MALKFIQGDLTVLINKKRQFCVVGALARSQGISVTRLGSSSTEGIVGLLAPKLKLSERTLESLVRLNDLGRWARLENRLRSLELLHLVRPFSSGSTKVFSKQAVTA